MPDVLDDYMRMYAVKRLWSGGSARPHSPTVTVPMAEARCAEVHDRALAVPPPAKDLGDRGGWGKLREGSIKRWRESGA